MRLVVRLRQHELDGADDALSVLGDEQRAFAGVHAVSHLTPEGPRPLGRERAHEADACAAVDAVDEQRCQPLDLRLVESVQAAYRNT